VAGKRNAPPEAVEKRADLKAPPGRATIRSRIRSHRPRKKRSRANVSPSAAQAKKQAIARTSRTGPRDFLPRPWPSARRTAEGLSMAEARRPEFHESSKPTRRAAGEAVQMVARQVIPTEILARVRKACEGR